MSLEWMEFQTFSVGWQWLVPVLYQD